jgi:prolipoprotein diacylglyceryltransferase
MEISIYSLILGVFSAAGLIWSGTKSVQGVKAFRQKESTLFTTYNSGLALLAGMLIGARVSYVLVHLPRFEESRWEVLNLGLGGLDWMGLTLGGLVALFLYAGFSNISPLKLFDLNYPLVVMVVVGMWIGAQIAGVGYGQILDKSWWGLPVMDASGDVHSRVPYSAIGAIISIAVIIFQDRFGRKTDFSGVKLLIFGSLQFALLFGYTFFRKDPMVIVGNQPLERYASLIHLGVACISILLLAIINARNKSEKMILKQITTFKSNSE